MIYRKLSVRMVPMEIFVAIILTHLIHLDLSAGENISVDDCSSEYSDWSRNENSDAEYECYLDEESASNGAAAAANSTSLPVRILPGADQRLLDCPQFTVFVLPDV